MQLISDAQSDHRTIKVCKEIHQKALRTLEIAVNEGTFWVPSSFLPSVCRIINEHSLADSHAAPQLPSQGTYIQVFPFGYTPAQENAGYLVGKPPLLSGAPRIDDFDGPYELQAALLMLKLSHGPLPDNNRHGFFLQLDSDTTVLMLGPLEKIPLPEERARFIMEINFICNVIDDGDLHQSTVLFVTDTDHNRILEAFADNRFDLPVEL